MSTLQQVGRAIGGALGGPVGALLGGIGAAGVQLALGDADDLVSNLLGTVATDAFKGGVERLVARLPQDQTPAQLNHDLARAFHSALALALEDIGGTQVFPDAWQGARAAPPPECVYPDLPRRRALWASADPRAAAMTGFLQELRYRAQQNTLLPEVTPRAAASLEALTEQLFDLAVLPQLEAQRAALRGLPDAESHLREHLFARTLLHLGEVLKQTPPAWIAFTRLLLEGLHSELAAVRADQRAILTRLEGLATAEQQQAVAERLAELVVATGNTAPNPGEPDEAWLQRLVEEQASTVAALRGLAAQLDRVETLLNQVYDAVRGQEQSAAALLADALDRFAQLPLTDVPAPVNLPPRSSVPYPPNPLFLGRDAALLAVAAGLMDKRVTVIAGMPGVGKTQLATEAAHRYGPYFGGGVFWLNAADPATLDLGLAQLGGAAALNLAGIAELPLAEQAALVRQTLAEPVPRLLVLDNCEDVDAASAEAVAARVCPVTGGTRLLVTSRRAQWDRALDVALVALNVLERTASVQLLTAQLPQLDQGVGAQIAGELGDLPLALQLAGGFLTTYARVVPPAEYLAQLRAPGLLQHPSLTGRGSRRALTDRELHLGRTFALSVERLRAADLADARARALLQLLPWFAPNTPILLPLWTAALAERGDPLLTEDAVQRIVNLGLVEQHQDVVRVHQLVAQFVADTLEPAALTPLVEAFSEFIRLDGDHPDLANSTLLMPHLQHLVAQRATQTDAPTLMLQYVAGMIAGLLGDLTMARHALERLLTDAALRATFRRSDQLAMLSMLNATLIQQGALERAIDLTRARLQELQADQTSTATEVARVQSILARVLVRADKQAEAVTLLEAALPVQQTALGAAHSHTALSQHLLATALRGLGRWGEAVALMEQELAAREQRDGVASLSATGMRNDLADLLRERGEYARAAELLPDVIRGYTAFFGPHHRFTVTARGNLALVRLNQGALSEARSELEHVLRETETHHGADDLIAASIHNALSIAARAQGDLVAARRSAERAVAIRRAVLGTSHRETATALTNLGSVLYMTGDPLAAHAAYVEARDIQLRIGMGQSAQYAVTLSSLGAVTQQLGDPAAARAYLAEALPIAAATFGEQHQAYANILDRYAQILLTTTNEPTAALFRRAHAILTAHLGPEHQATLATAANLAFALQREDGWDESRALLDQLIPLVERVYGAEHYDLATMLDNRAKIHARDGELEAAIALGQRAVAINIARLGERHPTTAQKRLNLALRLRQQGALVDARAEYEAALIGYDAQPTPPPDEVGLVLRDLLTLLRQLGDHSAAVAVTRRRLRHVSAQHGDASRIAGLAQNDLGLCLRAVGEHAESLAAFQAASAILRETGAAARELGNVASNAALAHNACGDRAGTVAQLRAAEAWFVSDPAAITELAWVRTQLTTLGLGPEPDEDQTTPTA